MFKLKNIGKTKTVFYKDGKLKKNEIDWTLNTDNKNGLDLNINMNDDGNNMHYHQYLTTRELEELLKKPVVNKNLEDRLIDDFNPYDNNQYDNNLIQSPSFQSSQPLMIVSNKKSKTIRPKIYHIKLCSRKKNHHKHRHHHNRTISNSNRNSNRNRSKKHKKRSYSNTTSM